ncbi:MAG TPA: UDP-N-acetylmuramoyl-L-alanyl-D-glutamate--2,6-diaminopimelate ligase [Flavobacteriales bacterium]|nr:UDP-N-acetylmuramoyl-L-alanyl-D-glutamate--2,6-diaminopimelate ligase [Flavobacteriales bacterium]
MKLLRDLLYKVTLENVIGLTNMAIDTLTYDSRKQMKFGLFVAIKGEVFDGHKFIDQAIEKGAIAILCQDLPTTLNPKVTYVTVEDSRKALAYVAANYFDHPSAHLKLIGVTGTNGKTSITTMLFHLFKSLGVKSGLISTIVNKIDEIEIQTQHTTPDPIALNSLLRQMVDNGCSTCFMEVSSHAMNQERVRGLNFSGGVFTNLTHDHLDYHSNFHDYLLAKKKFFDNLDKQAFALINDDDKYGEKMVTQSQAKIKRYALKTEADFKGKLIESRFDGMLLNIDGEEVWVKLIGGFNASNILAVYGVAMLLGYDKTDVLKVISALNPVEGRFQFTRSSGGISAIVDYAHTPDALEKVLETIKEIRTGNETVITVVGCGGDRDREKRPIMAQIASSFSDQVVLTSDNPRSEDPAAIIDEMYAGVDASKKSRVLKITDRKEAIKTACTLARDGDIVLIAGKGHEKYQDIKGVRHPFDDMKVLKEILK